MTDEARPTDPRAPGEVAESGGSSERGESTDLGPADHQADSEPGPPGLTEAALEALLFVAERPLSRRDIGTLSGVDRQTVDARLGDLEVTLRTRGIRLILSEDRVELATAPEAGHLVARYVGADAVRLTPASLETVAIVAYRQPITKSGIERIRGVDSDYTVRSLLHRRLVVELGRSDTPGRPILYGTSFEFLERFGLTSLDDMPPLDADVAATLVDPGDTSLGAGDFGADDGGADAPPTGAFEALAPNRDIDPNRDRDPNRDPDRDRDPNRDPDPIDA